MRFRSLVLVLLLVVGCGKVGEPLPPFIRIPEPVMDLAVSQNGYELVLTWTNPARYVDGSAATDLSRVEIRSNGSVIANINVTAAAAAQSYLIPVDVSVGSQRSFTIQVETAAGRMSSVSSAVSVVPVDVPGRVTDLRAVVDQRRIRVEWNTPKEHPELAQSYVVTRSDLPAESHVVTETRYEDSQYEPGKTLTYLVTALRRISDRTVSGVGPESRTVTVEDKTPPQVPAGLDPAPSDTGVFLTWAENEENDLSGYRIFRSERADGDFTLLADRTTNSYFDPAGRSGLYYAVSAVDESGNESARTVPFRIP